MPDVCWSLWNEYAPFSPETPIVCACENNAWATKALVSDLPATCINQRPESSFTLDPGDWINGLDEKQSLLAGQRFIFIDGKDRMSGFLMALPACCWFVLRVVGLGFEFLWSIVLEQEDNMLVSGLLCVSMAMAPLALLRFFLELHIAESNPNLVFAAWSSTTQWVSAFALVFCLVILSYLGTKLGGGFEGDSEGGAPMARHCCCLCCVCCCTLPWFVWELSWGMHVNSFTFGLNLQFLLNYPEISLSMRISALRVVTSILFFLDLFALLRKGFRWFKEKAAS